MDKYKVITGTAIECERELNKINKTYDFIIEGMSTTNEQTTVIIQIAPPQ